MTFSVAESNDLAPIREALQQLAQINSPNLDIDAEAQLPHARFWTASEDAQSLPIAYALVWLVADEVEIVDVATYPTARRRGAAKTLLHGLLEAYRRQGRQAAFLEVRASNLAATKLYGNLGFERTRVRRGYYADGEDAWEMRLPLSDDTESRFTEVDP